MLICGKVTHSCFVALLILGFTIRDKKPSMSPQMLESQQVSHKFPVGSIQCRTGDYIIVKAAPGSWKVYRVDEMFFVSRLLTMGSSGDLSVVEAITIADSATPPRWQKIQLLLNEFKQQFSTREETIKAIESNSLGEFTRGLCRGVEEFPKDTCEVYTKR